MIGLVSTNAVLHAQETFRRGTEYLGIRQVQECRIGRRAGSAESKISTQRVTAGGRAKALREIDLVAVSRFQVILYRRKCTAVAIRCEVGSDLAVHAKIVRWKRATLLQAVNYLRQQLRRFRVPLVRNQTCGMFMMIQQQRPVVYAYRHFGFLFRIPGNARFGNRRARQVVTPDAQCAAGKRHIRHRLDSRTQFLAQQRERIAGHGCSLPQRVAGMRGQNVIARHAAAIQPYRPGHICECSEVA